jgi:type I restriction enzyme S subunit
MKIADSLRKSVLQAAIQGKLTEQLSTDGDAADLLGEIRAEKARLIKEGKLKKETPLPPITDDEIPFDIPENWTWCRLGEIVSLLGDGLHGTPNFKYNGEYFFINGNNLDNGKIIIKDNTQRIDYNEYIKYKKELGNNSVLVSINGTLGNVGFYNEEKIILGKSVCFFNLLSQINKKFIRNIIDSTYFIKYSLNSATGTTIKNVSLNAMKHLIIPLPPLPEQERIVEKLEQVLPEIDKLEKDETQLEALQHAFPGKMRNALLQTAIQGKLTEQLSTDGDATDLLAEIRTEKARLIKEGKLKKEMPLPPITDDEIPFDIPENWTWCRLGEIVSLSSGKSITLTKEGKYPIYGGNGINGYTNNYFVEKDCLIIGRVGFYCGNTYKTFSKCWVTDNALIVTEKLNLYNKNFLLFLFNFLNLKKTSVATAQPVISGKRIENLVIPLPPLPEQERIVERLDELLPLCEKLE